MNRFVWGILCIAAFGMQSCKPSQPVSTGSGGTEGSSGTGGTQASTVAVFARELPAFRVTPESSDKYEQFDGTQRADPTQQGKPEGPVSSVQAIDPLLKSKLYSLQEARKNIEETMGYRILIYSGSDVAFANECVKQLDELLEMHRDTTSLDASIYYVPSAEIDFDYVAPNYMVKMGHYLSRIQAHAMYIQLKENFPQAIVTSEAVKIQR